MLEKEGGLSLLERLGASRRPHALHSAIQRLVNQTIERCRRFRADSSYAASDDEEEEAAGQPVTCASSDEDEPVAQQPNAGVLLFDLVSDDEFEDVVDYFANGNDAQ
jgi:hypothetical protein